MAAKILDALFDEYRRLRPEDAEGSGGITAFAEFLARHGGMRRLEPPGKPPRLLGTASDLRCFHYSQYLEWYLPEKLGAPARDKERAREALRRFNEWLMETGQIGREIFEESRESILGEAEPAAFQNVSGVEEDENEEDENDEFKVPEERDFYVPGEYAATLSGEFLITKVQEGILYGRRSGDVEEVGPILVDRAVSSGHKVGDRVHLSLGKAGDHWNLLGLGRPER
ncbi:MAG TPA: hypothetical protein VFW45_05855 [Candidatus Polarisedimenticolia bacterium]|nr:hypothetical protein [Candidatus Polarisedimenticolia bacterium]